MLYINPEVCIDCDLCVAQCPVEAIYPEDQVPEKWSSYIKLNAEECEKYPTIFEKQEPLPTAKTLEELLKEDKQ